MPIETNADRNTIIFDQWQSGKTINEISLSTGIPRGTVGYYVRKFNILSRKGQSPAIIKSTRKKSEIEISMNIIAKTLSFQPILDMIKSGDFERCYYYLSTIKLLSELRHIIGFDQEEMKRISQAFDEMASQSNK